MKEKILKTSIACMLIISLTAINLISTGAGLVTYALDYNAENTVEENTVAAEENRGEAVERIVEPITLESKVEDQKIYKGSLKANVEKQYVTKTAINVNEENAADVMYVNEEKTSIPTEYQKTTINKKELMAILGEEGILEISTIKEGNKESLTTITKTSIENEEGNVVIQYPEGTDNLSFRTTKTLNAGTITLEHTKLIKPENIESLKNVNEMVSTTNGTYQKEGEEKQITPIQNTVVLTESATKATLEVSRTSLSTVEPNEGVEIKAILNSNSEENELYKNPTVEIEFPADVTEVQINNIAKLYGDEYTNERAEQIVREGKQVIRITLEGTQTEYKEPGVEGTELVIDANLVLNNKATNKEDTVKMLYTNENATKYENGEDKGVAEVKMQIVSPKSLIAVNNISDLGIETIGEEETVSQEIEKETTSKEVTVNGEIINNNESTIENVAILGTLGTDNKENNMHAKVTSGITTSNPEAKVYYTENEEATAEVENAENGWNEEVTENSKKYLITMPKLDVAQNLNTSYKILIPENLQPNQKTTTGYQAGYTQTDTGIYQEAQSTDIELNTGKEEVAEEQEQPQEEIQNNEEVQVQNQEDIVVKVEQDKNSGSESFIQVGGNTSYIARITNTTNNDMKDVKLKWNISGEVKILSQLQFSEEAYGRFTNPDPEYTGEGDITTLSTNPEQTVEIPANSTQIIYILVEAGNIQGVSQEYKLAMRAEHEGNTYISNETVGTIKSENQYDVSLTASKENEYIKPGENIEYIINIKNNNDITANGLAVQDAIPEELSIQKITVGNEEQEVSDNNTVVVPVDLNAGEEKQVKILTTLDYKSNMEEKEITNKATLTMTSGENKETNEVRHSIVPEELEGNVYDENGNLVTNGVAYSTNATQISTEHRIRGYAWEDINKDGQKQDSENTLSGIKVQLLDINQNKIATKSNGEELTATTNEQGNYEIADVPQGEYIALFEYDASAYKPTNYKTGSQNSRNSNVVAKKANINGEEKTYGVTDTIRVSNSNISNINIGLTKSEKFDLKLEKTVSKIIVQTSKGNEEQTFNNETLAKAEIHRKEIEGANVIIEYKIRVANEGELDGYVKNIVDYLPQELTFSSELNKDWYQDGNNLYNNTLSNKKLAVGESKEVTLTLTKKMSEENTGTITNVAEIAEDHNNAGVTDINSTPANQKQGENDMSQAAVILSIKTGETEIAVILTIIAVIVLSAVAFFIRREMKMKENM